MAGAGAVVEDGGGVGTPNAAAAAAAAAAAGGDASGAVLQAVTAQRDRFRARIVELEGGQAQLSAEVQQALARADDVTRDNVALVEKIRCVVFLCDAGGGGRQMRRLRQQVVLVRMQVGAVLQAVTAQRSRIRARVVQLEGGQAQLRAQVEQALARADAVTRDNVALVEKIRCVICLYVCVLGGGGKGDCKEAGTCKGRCCHIKTNHSYVTKIT